MFLDAGPRDVVAVAAFDWAAAFHDRLNDVATRSAEGEITTDARSAAAVCIEEGIGSRVLYSQLGWATSGHMCHRNITDPMGGRGPVVPWGRTHSDVKPWYGTTYYIPAQEWKDASQEYRLNLQGSIAVVRVVRPRPVQLFLRPQHGQEAM